jgi:hypothetical protein
MTTINGTITTGAVAQWQAALNASTSVVIKNNAALEQLIVSATGPAGPLNGLVIDTALVIDSTGKMILRFSRHSLMVRFRYGGRIPGSHLR